MKLLLIIVLVVVARAEAQSQRGPPPSLDTNNDGYITKAEMVAQLGADKITDSCWQAVFKRADKNEDNKMGIEEFNNAYSNSKGEELEACKTGNGKVDEPAPEPVHDGPGGGASSMTAAVSVMSLLALTLCFF